MAALTTAERQALRLRAKVIRDEIMLKANTANRVGSLFYDIVEYLGSMDLDELQQHFLSKTDDDTAQGVITFLKELKAKGGISIGEFVEGLMNGRGAAFDAQGNGQVQSLEVRGPLKVLELIVNRLSAQEGDFVFTESGVIEKVEWVAERTYLLTLRKRWDYDFHAFREGDVVYGSMNTLLADGSSFESWFRVLETDTAANTMTVVVYPDDEVPASKNFVPVTSMVVKRRGNAMDENRQSCWYISSYEGVVMYLEGVTKPILDESNYYLSLGKPKHLSLFNGLPVNYNHPYIFARGAIIQDLLRIDFSGNPIYEVVDLGTWNDTAEYVKGYSEEYRRYIQHQVWYESVCWRCIVAKAEVGVPPRWNSTDWIAVAGNFHVDLGPADGQRWFRGSDVYTTLVAAVYHGDMDISGDITDAQVQWTRISGKPEEDAAWAILHQNDGLQIAITPNDLPSDWLTCRMVQFKVTVSVRPGSETSAIFGLNT